MKRHDHSSRLSQRELPEPPSLASARLRRTRRRASRATRLPHTRELTYAPSRPDSPAPVHQVSVRFQGQTILVPTEHAPWTQPGHEMRP